MENNSGQKATLRILYLEDDSNDVVLVQSVLEAEGLDCQVVAVETKDDFLAQADKGGFDLFFADYTLPSFDGMSALALARKKYPDVPFLFVTGTLGEELAIESLKNGATDYIFKRRLPRLVPSVLRALREVEERAERKKIEARMVQSEKLSAVGQLAAGIAHEINNPLGVILGFAQGMARRITPGDRLEVPIKSIEREAVRCKNLVQDLLTFSRSTNMERMPMDLNEAVKGALSLIQAQAKFRQVEVRTELTSHLPSILGSKNQIQQVVLNLANNGLDAMAAGGILTVRTELIKISPLYWVCLKISDTGTGIPPEILGKIFEPFFTTKPVGEGTGLGLSLVNEIVQKHSGTIDVQSNPGFTEFCIKFPTKI